MLFARKFTVYTEFATVSGLQDGAEVRVAGMTAGEVTDVWVPSSPAAKFRVRLQIREDLHPLVRTDSVATIRTEGLVGGKYLQVGVGSERAPRAPAGSTIPSQEPFEIADLLQQASTTVRTVNETIVDLRGDVETTIRTIAETAADADQLVNDVGAQVRDITRTASQIANDTQAIVRGVREGRGAAGQFITDDQIYRRAVEIAGEARQTVDNLRAATEEARRMVQEAGGRGGAQGVVAGLRETIDQAHEAMASLAEDTEALKHNWFFSGYFKRRGYFSLADLSPADYRQGALEKGNRVALRIWLRADLLFVTEPGSTTPVLTSDGSARLDSAMAGFLTYRGSGPFVVEGYATEGTPAERLITSRRFASAVRSYLIDRFDLVPSSIAVMPLGLDAAGSPAGGTWDGVALAMFVEKKTLQNAAKQSRKP
jgi:phospholipid/cholesterol/gamma-HCH transport system substrate-binding protein